MESKNNPLSNDTSINNNLIAFNVENSNETQSNKFIIPIKKGLSLLFLFALILPSLIIMIISFDFVVFIFLLVFDVMIILTFLYIFEKQMELTKDTSNNIFNLKTLTYFRRTTLEIQCNLENILFFWFNGKMEENNNIKTIKRLFVINTLRNLSKINFDLNSVKHTSIFLFKFFDEINPGKDGGNSLENKLNSFFGVEQNIDNPLKFNIDKYMYKNNNEYDKFLEDIDDTIKFHQIMKFSDHFFTFFFDNYLSILKPKRIDFIFSSNFDTIFIGEVKRHQYYGCIHEFKINTIEKFVFIEDSGYFYQGYNLKVKLKENYEYKDIFLFIVPKESLKGLIYLLNEKILNVNADNLEQFFEDKSS